MTEAILDCGHPPSPHSDITTGYGEDENGKKYCYDCCAKRDREQMDKDGKTTLYLTHDDYKNHQIYQKGKVTNWPGSLSYPCDIRKGRHNISGSRYDVWFIDYQGKRWHGVQYGENTQLCHCKRLK